MGTFGAILVLVIPVFVFVWWVCDILKEIWKEEKEISQEKQDRRFKQLVREVIEEYNESQ
jgi:hypothetical protein